MAARARQAPPATCQRHTRRPQRDIYDHCMRGRTSAQGAVARIRIRVCHPFEPHIGVLTTSHSRARLRSHTAPRGDERAAGGASPPATDPAQRRRAPMRRSVRRLPCSPQPSAHLLRPHGPRATRLSCTGAHEAVLTTTHPRAALTRHEGHTRPSRRRDTPRITARRLPRPTARSQVACTQACTRMHAALPRVQRPDAMQHSYS